ncbi:MAG: hypothetical protein FJX76_04120 [Armatimonadetes bacterium]|nr:hypothetical protein [Armatimonadota bacterium]
MRLLTLFLILALSAAARADAPQLILQTGHQEMVRAVAFSADGRVLATGSSDGTVKVWNPETGHLLATLTPPDNVGIVYAIAVSPDGTRLASAQNERVILWDLKSGKPLATWTAHGDYVTAMAFSPDGKRLATAPGGGNPSTSNLMDSKPLDTTAVLWDVSAEKPTAVASLPHPQGVQDLRFNGGGPLMSPRFAPDGGLLALAGPDENVTLWPASGKSELPTPGLVPLKLAFSGDGRRLAAVGSGDLLLWDTATWGTRMAGKANSDRLEGIAVSPDGRRLALSGYRSIRVFDVASGQQSAVLEDGAEALAFTPDGDGLASARANEVKLWSLEGSSPPRILKASDRDNPRTQRLGFSPNGRLLAQALYRTLVIWEVTAGKSTSVELPAPAQIVVFSPDGRTLAVGMENGQLDLLDVATRRLRKLRPPNGRLISMAVFSPDGRQMLIVGGKSVALFNLASGARRELPLEMPRLGWARWQVGTPWYTAISADARLGFFRDDNHGTVSISRLKDGDRLALMIFLRDRDEWMVISPDGFFDGSPAGWQGVLWRLRPDDIADVAVPEQFFSEFFQPGLLTDILREGRPIREILRARGDARADLRMENKDRRLPQVAIQAPAESARRTVRVTVTLSGAAPDGGVRDARLFRNGTLVARWSGPQANGPVSVEIPIEAGENRLTAYAFNSDNVKSQDATAVVRGAPSLAQAPHAYVLCIGINQYAEKQYDLEYAVADAESTTAALRSSLPFPAENIDVRTLLNKQATRAGILEALQALVARAEPEDTVIISFSGHGFLHAGHFYMVPHDMAGADPARCIGDDALEKIFLPLQARNVALILDACHSGQALASDEWRRGPMNARGLVQLAYEKGIEILAASQSQQAALEAWELGGRPIKHGLLTYALIVEGLTRARWRDGRLLARDWLDYAAERVPAMLGSGRLRGRDLVLRPSAPRPVQTPRVFHRREGGGDWAVAGAKK